MNKALRICFRSKRDDSNYFNHLKAEVLPLHLRRKCSILKLMYSQDEMQSSIRVTRSNRFPKLTCDFPNSENFRRSISYTSPKYWERLPGRLKNLPDPKAFKQELKVHFRDLFIESGFV